MTDAGPKTSEPFYRVDRFAVPLAARLEFLGIVAATHELLRRQDGFVRDYILERPTGPEELGVVTFVEWQSAGVVEHVSKAVAAYHSEIGFDRTAALARLGVKADIGSYRPADAR